jgi:hypothetical protein
MKLVLPMSFETDYREKLSARGVDASCKLKLLHLELRLVS